MKLYIKFLGIYLRSAMQHKAAFFMMMLSQITTSLASLLIVYFLFDRFGQVDGFNFEEVLICYAVVLKAFSLHFAGWTCSRGCWATVNSTGCWCARAMKCFRCWPQPWSLAA